MSLESNRVRIRTAPPEPGKMLKVDIAGVPVAVASINGRLAAFDDTCTHQQCSLSEGSLAGPTVMCPCHKSRFDLRFGDALGGPADEPIRIRSITQDGDELVIEA